MLGFLYRWIIGTFSSCQHTLETIETYNISDGFGRKKGLLYVQKCKKCGKILKTKVMP